MYHATRTYLAENAGTWDSLPANVAAADELGAKSPEKADSGNQTQRKTTNFTNYTNGRRSKGLFKIRVIRGIRGS